MLYKPLVALFMALAATGGVTASTTPVRRGGGGGNKYPPPSGPTVPAGSCNTNTQLSCCNSLTAGDNPIVGLLTGVFSLSPDVLVGLNCLNLGVVSGNPTCDGSSLCCANTYQSGLVNIGCTRASL